MSTPRQRLLSAIKANPDLIERLLYVAEDGVDHVTVSDPQSAYAVCAPLVGGFDHERFAVVALDRRNRVIDSEVLTVGSDGYCVVDPRQVFRWALTRERPVATVLLTHNHPSGDPRASAQDDEVTRRVAVAGRTIGIRVVDHVIVGSAGRSYSYLESNPGALGHY